VSDSAHLIIDCPRCAGTGKVDGERLSTLAAIAWEAHKNDEHLPFIQAVKMFRAWTGMGLHDAKDAIERARAAAASEPTETAVK
jgi:hypothetical protein